MFGLWTPGHFDSGRLDSGRLDAWTLDSGLLDAWTLDTWTRDDWKLRFWTIAHLDFGRLHAWTRDASTPERLNVWNHDWTQDSWNLKPRIFDVWAPEKLLGKSSMLYSIFFKTMLVLTVISQPQSHWNFCTGLFQNFYHNYRTLKFYRTFPVVTNFNRFFIDKANRNLKSY